MWCNTCGRKAEFHFRELKEFSDAFSCTSCLLVGFAYYMKLLSEQYPKELDKIKDRLSVIRTEDIPEPIRRRVFKERDS